MNNQKTINRILNSFLIFLITLIIWLSSNVYFDNSIGSIYAILACLSMIYDLRILMKCFKLYSDFYVKIEQSVELTNNWRVK